MYEEEIHFQKLLLQQLEMVLEHLTLVTFDPNIKRVLLLPKTVVWTSLSKVGLGILELLIGNSFGTFDPSDLDLIINRVFLLPKMDVCNQV